MALVLSSVSWSALLRSCRSYSNVHLSPGHHAYIPTACCQSPLLYSLLPCTWIFHNHLSCPNGADLSLVPDHPLLSILLKPKPTLSSFPSVAFPFFSDNESILNLQYSRLLSASRRKRNKEFIHQVPKAVGFAQFWCMCLNPNSTYPTVTVTC